METVSLVMLAVVACVFFIFLFKTDVDPADEPYMILKTKYRENYKECIRALPRDKDCVIADVTMKVIDVQE